MRQRRPLHATTTVQVDDLADENGDNGLSRYGKDKPSSSLWWNIQVRMKLPSLLLQIGNHPASKVVFLMFAILIMAMACKALVLFFIRHNDPSTTITPPISTIPAFPILDPIQQPRDAYHIMDCPERPPPGYPREYPILDVLQNWNVSTVTTDPEGLPREIFQGVCVFDVVASSQEKVKQQVEAYRAAEVPFVIRNDPAVLKSVALWNRPNYLVSKTQGKQYRATLSNTTIMTYYSLDPNYNEVPPDFNPPTTGEAPMSFQDWYGRAVAAQSTQAQANQQPENHEVQNEDEDKNEDQDQNAHNSIHPKPTDAGDKYAYLRLDACLPDKRCDSTYRGDDRFDSADWIYEDLPFFQPSKTTATTTKTSTRSSSSHTHNADYYYYEIDGNQSRGIQCRFGTAGMVAETHFDNERNYVVMMGGARRFLLAHPRNCPSLYLYPQKHPLERHTRVDFANPPPPPPNNVNDEQQQFPHFSNTTINEVVLQAGDVLYLPTYWFHHIISLTLNYQCNTRSGYSVEYDQTIYDCGFFYDFPAWLKWRTRWRMGSISSLFF